MRRHYFIKTGAPVWIHVPGTPFTLPGETTKYERLPGMIDWAPRGMITRVGKGLKTQTPTRQLVDNEVNRGLPQAVGAGAAGGATAGMVAAKLLGGERFIPSVTELMQTGVTPTMRQNFRKLPGVIKALPFIGTGAGLLYGAGKWHMGKQKRREQAQGVAKGLLTEQILQQHDLNRARASVNPTQHESASDATPTAVTLSNKGI